MEDITVRVHFISGETKIVPINGITFPGEEGERSAWCFVDGREIPIYNRVEWGFLWEEQGSITEELRKHRLHARMDAYHTESE